MHFRSREKQNTRICSTDLLISQKGKKGIALNAITDFQFYISILGDNSIGRMAS